MRCANLGPVVFVLALTACIDQANPVGPAPSENRRVISDGAHAGNDHFYFLPSMVPEPYPTGTFDPTLSPEVQVCVSDGSACSVILAAFTTEAGYGAETIRVNQVDEHYIVNWHTAEILDSYPLAADEVYRVRVLAEGQELGFADLAVVSSGKELRNVSTDEYVALKDGRTLPIKFRIEEGAIQEGLHFTAAAAGERHSCAVATNGDGYCWGDGTFGQLGVGYLTETTYPQLVTGGHKWQAIEPATFGTCGLTVEGAIYCWGLNAIGSLGLGHFDLGPYPTPQPVTGNLSFTSLATSSGGNLGSCGVAIDGNLYCWGLNLQGQLGIGSVSYAESSPTLAVGGYSFHGPIALTQRHGCALTSENHAVCWGQNGKGQLGRGFIDAAVHPAPAPVVGGHRLSTITVGASHSCGIDESSAAICWGNSRYLGIDADSGTPVPSLIDGGVSYSAISAGFWHICGLRADGEGVCWGSNSNGQLGRGFASGDFFMSPGLISGNHNMTSISSGWAHTCATNDLGEALCWGANHRSQSGGSPAASVSSPQVVPFPNP